MKKWLFLKWCLVNILTIVVFYLSTRLCFTQISDLSLVGKAMVDAIIAIYVITTIYCGFLCWKTDTILEELADASLEKGGDYYHNLKRDLHRLNHQADHVSFASNECPYIGLLGAVTGIYVFMTSNVGIGGIDPSHIKEVMANALVAIGIAFIPTITGIFFRIVLSWEHHIVTHEISYSLKEYKVKNHEK